MSRLPSCSPLTTRHSPLRGAFSLVELLVVITIIGILAALITKAAANALWTARQTAIKVELNEMAAAMERFKAEYGSYPPADLRFFKVGTTLQPNPGLKAFVARAFPRYNMNNLLNDFNNLGVDINNFDPARALVFWLQGFYPDVRQPFSGTGSRTQFFDFDKTRLVAESYTDQNNNGRYDLGEPYPDTNGNGRYDLAVYIPQNGKGTPYVYFDNRSYGGFSKAAYTGAGASVFSQPYSFDAGAFGFNNGSAGIAAPYALDVNGNGVLNAAESYTDSNNNLTYDEGESISDSNSNGYLDVAENLDTWASPTGFQIISAGQDGVFGTSTTNNLSVRLYPAGRGYDTADDDNITNFCDKSSLDAAKP